VETERKSSERRGRSLFWEESEDLTDQPRKSSNSSLDSNPIRKHLLILKDPKLLLNLNNSLSTNPYLTKKKLNSLHHIFQINFIAQNFIAVNDN